MSCLLQIPLERRQYDCQVYRNCILCFPTFWTYLQQSLIMLSIASTFCTNHALRNTVAKQVELKAVGDQIASIQQRMQGEAASAARQIAETAMA